MFLEQNSRITDALNGRTVEYVYTDREAMVIRTTCGHEVRVVWRDEQGQQTRGRPVVEGVAVKIALPPVTGQAATGFGAAQSGFFDLG